MNESSVQPSRTRIDVAEAVRPDTGFMTRAADIRKMRRAHARTRHHATIGRCALPGLRDLIRINASHIGIRRVTDELRAVLLRLNELLADFSAGQALSLGKCA